jgi:hypothetical protein
MRMKYRSKIAILRIIPKSKSPIMSFYIFQTSKSIKKSGLLQSEEVKEVEKWRSFLEVKK